ncbi:hypothetical protein AB0M97_29390 [Streptomyces sp. NPDC051207]|uniref:hypothetical protein n=1 Tax=Streptomyces sp. NPDC051207 TaxID=3154641 RepID=UPI00342102BA
MPRETRAHKHLRLPLASATAAAPTGALLTFTAVTATGADATHVARADSNGGGKGHVTFSAQRAHVNGRTGAGRLVVLYGTGATSFGAATVGGPAGDAYFGDVLAG